MREILADLVAEQQALDQFLQRISDRDWKAKTPSPGWDIRDQVSHLAYTENFAADVIEGGAKVLEEADIGDIDEWTAFGVSGGRGKRHQEVIEWWRHGRARVVDALSRMDAKTRIPWVLGSMGAKSFATMRLMETWAHGLDIKASVDIRLEEDEDDPRADTPRIRHVAFLAWRMLPRSFELASETYPEEGIRFELMGPNYARWVFGPEDTEQVIKGVAGELCRVAVRRTKAENTGLKAIGDHAETALRVMITY